MLYRRPGFLRRAFPAALLVSIGAIAIACAKPDDLTSTSQAVLHKGGGANFLYCTLTVAAGTLPDSVRAGTDFDIPFTVTNTDTDDACNNSSTGFVVSGPASLRSPGSTPSSISIPANHGGDDNHITVTGHYHADSDGTAKVGIEAAGFGDTVSVAAVGPPDAPSSLTASSITSTTATVGWNNGIVVTADNTYLQIRVHGGTWPSDSTMVLWKFNSLALTGLTHSTVYDVRAWHVLFGIASDTTTAASLFTTSP